MVGKGGTLTSSFSRKREVTGGAIERGTVGGGGGMTRFASGRRPLMVMRGARPSSSPPSDSPSSSS
eukprot:7412836-Heterocapsa_arctica.AAC.1